MKKVAGRLRLDYAQFRTLESFAQIGSDLDAQTKAAIERGQRVTEVLKQPQYQPLSAAQQISIIYALNSGLLDDIAVADVRDFESKLYVFMKTKYKNLEEALTVASKFTDDLENQLKKAIQEFKEGYSK